MKSIPEAAVLMLWLISVLATAYVLRGTSLFTFLAPLYAICTIGSIITVRTAKR